MGTPSAPSRNADRLAAAAARSERTARDEGRLLLAFDDLTPYARYTGVDVLHTLQRPRTGEPAELSFIITTQVMELLFALVRQHWMRARAGLDADDVPAAIAALRRGAAAQDVLVHSWDLLATMTPVEYNRFRDALGEASGFQSATYRHLEFLLGNRSAALVRPHRAAADVHAALLRELREPSLYDAALRLLARRGLPVPEERIDRDWSAPCEPDPRVEDAWVQVYADDRPGNDLLALAEALLDTAERVTRWRERHLAAVRRAMGAKPGTGGSSGLAWLAENARRAVFPELWSLRTRL
ncbi:tryptophan 2,3-dioxygenase [Marinitenerispora sediminis]|uniref:Tryptophan 2,3-dioxygenase n=1 Tax=Marinitenerispora sediminis TaxID=1931232 RepID=A0A368T2K2_9ACTN|nr:tryptophan 2,3-dioxygenase family protein [Marinitenerispora sediminis]RCV49782.1 tryptophan 2,3-dioxygenase [Marinitenerispora sediminis]RCV50197.1 tryptophan 2,3-dioxygenase [Marinitenerispora sediminis]RCV55210.1 tryptophan 2,3-dioxygenase [Marinitenerispora sediminis]